MITIFFKNKIKQCNNMIMICHDIANNLTDPSYNNRDNKIEKSDIASFGFSFSWTGRRHETLRHESYRHFSPI